MDASKAEQIKSHAQAIAKLLYAETEETTPVRLETFEGIEQAIRSHILDYVGPEIGNFFVKQRVVAGQGAAVRLKASSATSKSQKSKRNN